MGLPCLVRAFFLHGHIVRLGVSGWKWGLTGEGKLLWQGSRGYITLSGSVVSGQLLIGISGLKGLTGYQIERGTLTNTKVFMAWELKLHGSRMCVCV